MADWSDRRGQFQRGKEVHVRGEPREWPAPRRESGAGVVDAVRRASITSADGLSKTTSNTTGAPASPTGGRRRSSNTALFANLESHKRGSEDYGERRQSHSEHGSAGVLSGWWGSTFKGHGPAQKVQVQPMATKEEKRGVME
ncbi:hypothetical protein LTR62_000924 [Meristemomyces frigidus]|uniref:Uncharacterized protein n=1 Tax=Meristemomyces frigidus TaxID=1508187 RepID=A0AAN7T8J2_9PEZI|nr:hypothetical protein LTR62_000924 [Meristemomyces frigidus]